MKLRFGTFVLILLRALGAEAQQPPPNHPEPAKATFAVRSQLVQFYLTVTSGNQRVTDLKLSDFTVVEDGTPREIERLDKETVPLQVALLFDISESMRDALPVTQEAAAYFVESLNPGDKVTLVSFNSDIRSYPQLTDDRSPIVDAIRGTQAKGGTKLYDALLFAMKLLSGKEGRKAIVSFSDGEDTGRSASLQTVLNAAARYGYPIYTIGAGAGLKRENLKRVLRQVAEINSGRAYFVTDPRDLNTAFLEVSAELRSAYVLNYYTQVPFNGSWHDVTIGTSNAKFKVHTRRGFYARSGGSSSIFSELPEAGRKAPIAVSDLAHREAQIQEKAAQDAVTEILERPVPAPSFDMKSLRAVVPPPAPAKKAEKLPVFKVETRLVEVPVLVESASGRQLPLLKESDFRIYEDDAPRELAFFSTDLRSLSMGQLRESAIKKFQASNPQGPALAAPSESGDLVFGRYYLILDDLMSDIGPFLLAKKSAETLIRELYLPLRPMSLHFTSEAQAEIEAPDNAEILLEKLKKSIPRPSFELTSNNNIMNVYQAHLIERGDSQARELAELRFASSQSWTFQNSLGRVQGLEEGDPDVIRNAVENVSRQMVTQNYMQGARTISGLRSVVSAAAAVPGDHPKTVIFISSGFMVGRGSARGDLAGQLERVHELAKRSGVKIFTVDANGLDVRQSLSIEASGSFLVLNPQLSTILESNASAWMIDRQDPLSLLAGETGGRFVHSTNDLTTGLIAAVGGSSRLYYLGYLSKQPVDGRFHRIRVTTSVPAARITGRKGYFAGQENRPETLAATTPDGESWDAVLARANAANKAGDMPQLVESLSLLVRRFPNQTDLWFNLGIAYLRLENSAAAIGPLQKAFILSPYDKAVASTLARALVSEGFHDAAAETLVHAIRTHARDPELVIQLGRVYEADGRPSDAYQIYRKVLDFGLAPPMDLYIPLTRTSIRLGRQLEAGLFVDDFLARGGNAKEIDSWRQMLGAGGTN